MKKIYLRFYEELNDFLPKNKKKVRFEHQYIDRASVKDVIESFGVPHTEIDLILVNGKSVRFDYLINDGDDISVYPVFELFDISDITKIREKPLRVTKFICDVHLGKLCKYLRMLGFDTLYSNQYSSMDIIELSKNEKRIILSKNYRFKNKEGVTHFYWIRSSDSIEQLKDLIQKMQLINQINPFTRCLNCNDIIHKIDKQQIVERLQPNTNKFFGLNRKQNDAIC